MSRAVITALGAVLVAGALIVGIHWAATPAYTHPSELSGRSTQQGERHSEGLLQPTPAASSPESVWPAQRGAGRLIAR